jgi:hypothetical protein
MVVTTAAGLAANVNGAALGGAVVIWLIMALILKEVAAYAGGDRLLPLHRAVTVTLIPLAVAVVFVLAQQFAMVV